MTLKHTTCINNSDPGQTYLKQRLKKRFKITFASPLKKAVEKNEEKKTMGIAKLLPLHANTKNT